MKDYVSIADLAIWLVLIAGRLILCFCIWKKGLSSTMPSFSLYAFASTGESILLLAIAFFFSYQVYYYVFYISSHVISAIAFLTLIECGRRVLPGLNLPQKEKAAALLLAAIVGIVCFVKFWPLRFIENRIELGAQLTVAVAFLFIASYSRYLGLYWSRLLAGISSSLGLLYLVQGVIRAIMWHYPSTLVLQMRQFSQITYALAIFAWIVVVLSPSCERELTEPDLKKIETVFARVEAGIGAGGIEVA
jgi:hypothetical protein